MQPQIVGGCEDSRRERRSLAPDSFINELYFGGSDGVGGGWEMDARRSISS